MMAQENFLPLSALAPLLDALDRATEEEDVVAVKTLLLQAGTNYSGNNAVSEVSASRAAPVVSPAAVA